MSLRSRLATGNALLGFCTDEEAWTLATKQDACDDQPLDPCDWIAISSETKVFDVSETFDGVWYTKNNAGAKVELDSFFGLCYGNCLKKDSVDEVCGGGSDEEQRGMWDKESGRCKCNEGNFGFRCDLSGPCPLLMVSNIHTFKILFEK
jgi:hypothetical protein